MFHRLVCSWTVQLALDIIYAGALQQYRACARMSSKYISSRIAIILVLSMHVGDPCYL